MAENKKIYGVDLMTKDELKAIISELGGIVGEFSDLAEQYIEQQENFVEDDDSQEFVDGITKQFDDANTEYENIRAKLNREVK